MPSNDSQPKDTESENQTVSSTGVRGGITSFISGLLWSGDDTPVDSSWRGAEFHQDSGREHQQSVFQEPNDKFDKSWEDVDMAELKSKVSTVAFHTFKLDKGLKTAIVLFFIVTASMYMYLFANFKLVLVAFLNIGSITA